ncbi:MAG: AAA family ATPase [Candidatus Cloacimonetes bacterium]|nr:AAA family ATPase [Candidatus Cloacimonadota bacterium]
MRRLGTEVEVYSKLINEKYIYVDKTDIVNHLITKEKKVFLSRPRKFGKTLLLDIISEIFNGNKTLFARQKISELADWEKHPVIRIDFCKIDFANAPIKQIMTNYLLKIAGDYRINTETEDCHEILKTLINKLSKKKGVVLLIDAYDKPINKFIEKKKNDLVDENIIFMKEFFSAINDCENNIRFLMITGTLMHEKVEMLNTIKGLKDITISSNYSNILGFSKTEIKENYSEYLKRTAMLWGNTSDEVVDMIFNWYGGYSWNGEPKLANPHSVLKFFDNIDFKCYSIGLGVPALLLKLMKDNQISAESINNHLSSARSLDCFNHVTGDPYSYLLYYGYLTIQNYNKKTGIYKLAYPNLEVKESIFRGLLEVFSQKKHSEISDYIFHIEEAFVSNNMTILARHLKLIFSGILPDTDESETETESLMFSIIFLTFRLISLKYYAEIKKENDTMNIDLKIFDKNYLLSFSFKKNESEVTCEELTDIEADNNVIRANFVLCNKKRNIHNYSVSI